MALRWTAAGMLEAEQQFRKLIGYQQLATLALAIERDLTRHHAPTTMAQEDATPSPPNRHTGTAVEVPR
jgi:hypothetical protein